MSEHAPRADEPPADPPVAVVPDAGLAEDLRAADSLRVDAVPATAAAVRERVAAGGVDGVVSRFDPSTAGGSDPLAGAARAAASGLPVVRVVPDGTAVTPADPDERTAHVREVGDWPAAVGDRMARLAAETPYRELYHAADEGLLLHPGNTPEVVATSDRLHELLGYGTDADLDIGDIVAGGDRFTRAEAAGAVDRALREGPQRFEWRDARRDGTELWVEVTLRPVEIRGREQVVATVRDIDERKAREREAEVAEGRREATLDRVSDAFFGLDTDWRFTYLNDRAADLIDVDREAVRGSVLWDEFSGAVGTRFEYEYRAALFTQEPTSFEARFGPLDAWFEVNVYPAPDGLSVYFRDVTGRKRREAELEAYERLVENVERKLFVLDEGGRFELVTEPLAEWLGRDREAVEGEAAVSLLTAGASDDGDAAAAVRAAVGGGEPGSFETDLVDPPGRRTGIVELSPLPSGAVGSLRDVTAERARQRSHDALIDNVPGMVYRRSVDTTNVDGGVEGEASVTQELTFASDAATSVAGRGPERLVAETDWVADVVHPEDRETVVEQLRSALAEGAPFTLRHRVVTPSGTRWVDDYGRPVTDREGRVTSIEGFVVDVTPRTQRERHRRVMMRVLRHNLRNSVQVITGFAAEIADRAADTEAGVSVVSLAGTIEDRAAELAAVSETARDVNEAVTAATDATGRVDVAALCRSVATERRESHPDATVSTALPDRLKVRGDSSLRRAVDALVENAIVHDEDDPTVRVSAFDPDRDGWVGIRITDEGPGIPERERVVLEAGTEITQLVHGRGLELWLVKWLVQSHGGELRIDVPGAEKPAGARGSTVTLLLPRAG